MNWLVYHIVSGQAFFTGVSLLMIASLSSLVSRPIYRRVTVLTFLIGVIAIVVSSTPIPYWLYAVATAITLTWIASGYGKSWRRWTPYANMAIWMIAALFEMPYHVTYSLNRTEGRSVAVIGDSVTAGVGGDEKSETWPSILGREHRLQIEDISHVVYHRPITPFAKPLGRATPNIKIKFARGLDITPTQSPLYPCRCRASRKGFRGTFGIQRPVR